MKIKFKYTVIAKNIHTSINNMQHKKLIYINMYKYSLRKKV